MHLEPACCSLGTSDRCSTCPVNVFLVSRSYNASSVANNMHVCEHEGVLIFVCFFNDYKLSVFGLF